MTKPLKPPALVHGSYRLQQLLQLAFQAQAREMLSRLTLQRVMDGDLPDTSHWARAVADSVKSSYLSLWQQGMSRSVANLARQGIAVNDLSPRSQKPLQTATEGRRVLSVTDVFGQRKSWQTTWPTTIAKAAKKNKPVVKIDFDLFNPRALIAVDAALMLFCNETNETATSDLKTATSDLRKLLKEGLERGDALRMLSNSIREIFADPARAFRIASTESKRALCSGQLFQAQESGVVKKKKWLASSDACKRPKGKTGGKYCMELNGKSVALDKPFWVNPDGGPYAVILYPPLHPHCFCDFTEEI